MYYTYILHSIEIPSKYYTGFTSDLKARLKKHNAKEVSHTAKYAPWELHAYFAFKEEKTARKFEKYLKSGSGREFAIRHFETD